MIAGTITAIAIRIINPMNIAIFAQRGILQKLLLDEPLEPSDAEREGISSAETERTVCGVFGLGLIMTMMGRFAPRETLVAVEFVRIDERPVKLRVEMKDKLLET